MTDLSQLATATLVKLAQHSEEWQEQEAALAALKSRRDLYNPQPVLGIALDLARPLNVRRAATAICANHIPNIVELLQREAERGNAPVARRSAALQALAALQMAHVTLPILSAIAANPGVVEVRAEAIHLVGVYCNLRSAELLLRLAGNPQPILANAAQAALERIFQRHGGPAGAADRLLQRAGDLLHQGHHQEAGETIALIRQLAPAHPRGLFLQAQLNYQTGRPAAYRRSA